MVAKRQKFKGGRSGLIFGAKPHPIFRAGIKNNKPFPASVLSHMAAHLLDNLVAQYNGSNNGDFFAARKVIKLYGWASQGSVHGSLTELLGQGFIEQTRQGGRSKCCLNAQTWLAIDGCGGELDVAPTKVAPYLWESENQKNVNPRFVAAWNGGQNKPTSNKRPKLQLVVGMGTK